MTEVPPITDVKMHPFRCYEVSAEGVRGDFVGGSYDAISVVTIACAFFEMHQGASVISRYGIGAYDTDDTLIAFIGRRDADEGEVA